MVGDAGGPSLCPWRPGQPEGLVRRLLCTKEESPLLCFWPAAPLALPQTPSRGGGGANQAEKGMGDCRASLLTCGGATYFLEMHPQETSTLGYHPQITWALQSWWVTMSQWKGWQRGFQ